jgi:uncharacterized protein YjcR
MKMEKQQVKSINNMEYQEDELREMISNLRIVKTFASRLVDEDELRLTKFELLLENYLENKLIKSIKL